jgi:hypothetical protein
MINKEFVKHLIQKLKTGNRASIHLNALPSNYVIRLDLNRLGILKNENGVNVFTSKKNDTTLSDEFLENLLSKASFNFEIDFWETSRQQLSEEQKEQLNYLSKRLDSIYYQHIDNIQEFGIKTFGFGFPLLIKRDRKDPSKIIKAPILIWQLEIEKSVRQPNCWTIKKQDDFPIAVNEILISHLLADENIQINSIPEEYLEDSIIQKEELLELCSTLLEQIKPGEGKLKSIKLEQCPSVKNIEETIGSDTCIKWSGMFGIFKSQKQSVLKELEWLVDNIDDFKQENEVKLEFETKLACVDTDPSQERIINKFSDSAIKIIQGPPGTGKSQTITAIITNALENKKKCLVICEKKTAIDVIYNNLNNIGMGNLCALIDDINKDRERIIKLARSKIDLADKNVFPIHEYKRHYKKYEELKKQVNEKVAEYTKPCFGDYNHKELVGLFLENQMIASSQDISAQIDSEPFQFNYDEYQELLEIVKKASIKSESYGLGIIQDKFFLSQPSETEKYNLVEKLTELLAILKMSKKQLDDYAQIAKYYDEKTFIKNFKSSTLGVFNKKTRIIHKQKIEIWKTYINLSSFYHQIELLKEQIPEFESFKKYSDINSYITEFSVKVEKCIGDFQYFWQYQEWIRYFNNLTQVNQQLITEIVKLPAEKREAAFKSWYLDQSLIKIYYRENLMDVYEDLHQLIDLKYTLRILQTERIITYWEYVQGLSVKEFQTNNGNIRQLYNFKRNKEFGRKNTLRKIIDADFKLFTDLFPVVLTNPVVCSSVIPFSNNLFDIVIFDEASQLRIEDTFTAYLRGAYKVISGDRHQMPPSSYFHGNQTISGDETNEESEENSFLAESESLLEFAEENAIQQTYLEFHYRSRHPWLIDFSNAAFYGNRLVPMPSIKDYQPIHFIQANGIYEESVNTIEAEAVVDILNTQIQPLSNGEMPSVGVATLNLYQRNLIWDKISERAFKDAEFSIKFARINANGFFVKNLENIQGDERDIIIISTTFGPDAEGTFRQNFGPINQANGYRLLNVIVSRAKSEMFVCSSIPPAMFLNFRQLIEEKGNVGRGIFYTYLSYAHAIENKNENERQNILDILSINCKEGNPGKHRKKIEGPFEHALKKYLMQHIDIERIKSPYQFGGLYLDMVVEGNNMDNKHLAMECNGGQNFDDEEAYIHMEYRPKLLKKYGFDYLYLWSLNFWQDIEGSFKKLIESIIV